MHEFFFFKVEDVSNCLLRHGVNYESLPSPAKVDENSLKDDGIFKYSFSKRISSKRLLEKFSQSVSEARRTYLDELGKAKNLLTNLRACKEMDNVFNDSEGPDYQSSEEEENFCETLKDGTKRLRCPLLKCNKKVFRLMRHLNTQHGNLSDSTKENAVKYAKLMIQLSGSKPKVIDDGKQLTKRESRSSTALVQRKLNFKQCCICSKLCKNISQHIADVHKVSRKDPTFLQKVSSSETIPTCYTKEENGKRILLTGKEMEDAKSKYSEEISAQKDVLQTLKDLRSKIKLLKQSLENESDSEERKHLQDLVREAEADYKQIRFKDTRMYSTDVRKWKEGFEEYLTMIASSNPVRGSRMAVDVLIPFEKTNGCSLTFSDLVDPRKSREILKCFRERDGITATSKRKYLSMFSKFMKYILTDPTSPERKACDDQSSIQIKGFQLKEVEHEIDIASSILIKKKGSDLIETKKKAAKKLITNEELNDLLESIQRKMEEVLNKSDEELCGLRTKDIRSIRDGLIAVGTLQLGRRSLEMTHMQLSEVEEAEEKYVDGIKYHIIKVAMHKNTDLGEPAPVAFKDKQFEVLKIYIEN